MKTDPAVEAYFAEAQSWDADRRALLDRSNRRAWRVAGAAVVVIVAIALVIRHLLNVRRRKKNEVKLTSIKGQIERGGEQEKGKDNK